MNENLVLSSRYRLLEHLAIGGMGEVWRATDELLDRPVAVKLLKPEFVSDEVARSRFLAEARFAASLQHRGIAQVYDYGEQDDLAYLVMELVPGDPLARVLAERGALTADLSLDIVAQAAQALAAAHAAGIIHRDIKPGNMMMTDDGIIKITDFGIARASAVSSMTRTGLVMGTAQYVSPEQATGGTLTPVSDLYSLGVVAYECLAGLPPFMAETPVAVALKQVQEIPPDLPAGVPAPVKELVFELLAKHPQDRPQSAIQVAERARAIRESLGGGSGVPPFPVAAPSDTLRAAALNAAVPYVRQADTAATGEVAGRRRGPLLVMASVGLVILVLGGIVIGALMNDSDGTRSVDPYQNRLAPSSIPTRETSPRVDPTETSAPEPMRSPTPSATRTSTTSPSPRPTATATTRSPEPTPSSPTSSPPPTSPSSDPTDPPEGLDSKHSPQTTRESS